MEDKIIKQEHLIHYLSSKLVFDPKNKKYQAALKKAKKDLLNLKYA